VTVDDGEEERKRKKEIEKEKRREAREKMRKQKEQDEYMRQCGLEMKEDYLKREAAKNSW